MDESAYLSVSVVIPVYNDAERLQKCLRALEQQTYPRDRIEVIVVDNNSDDPQKTEQVVKAFENVRLVCEPTPGSYAARNRGIAQVRHEVVAFTDSDCIPAPNWIENGVRHLNETPNCGLVAGRVELFFRNPKKRSAVELYESITAFPQQEFLEQLKGGATANVFTTQAVLDRVGSFNPQLKSFGDMDLGKRIFEAGYAQVYAEDTWVAHPARYTFSQISQHSIRVAGGVYDRFVGSQPSPSERDRVLAIVLRDDGILLWKRVMRALHDSRLKGWCQRLHVCVVAGWVFGVSVFEKLRLRFGGTSTR
ncbi:MAG: glycosyltransferase [Cyanobacteria bacterium SID2]|nr:glycosyltransferase [Cyanobacteria bacterium SID2]